MSNQQRKKNPSAFLRSLYQILMRKQVNQIICWAPDQNGFIIKNLQKFQQTILPQYFKHKKYSSFVRQLNMYGFHKQRGPQHQNCFLHDTFKKSDGIPVDIKRKSQKKKKSQVNIGKDNQSNNWFSIGKQLQAHFPHIVCYKSQSNQNMEDQKNQSMQEQQRVEQQSQRQENQISQQSQQYISKISLKGIFQNQEQKSEQQLEMNNSQNRSNQNVLQKKVKQGQNSQQMPNYGDMENQRCSNKSIVQNINSDNIISESKTYQNVNFYNTKKSIQNISSLSTLCEVLLKQNKILQSTHPKIRQLCISTQKCQIQLKKQQLSLLKQQQSDKQYNTKIRTNLQSHNKFLLQTTQMLFQKTCKLKQLSEQDTIISTTSIRFNLEK